jgi:hypothetical protein
VILAESIRRIKELFPSGSQDLYDWDTTKAWFFGFFNGLGAIAKEAVIDPVEALPAELCPATTTNLATEWEDALGLANTKTAQSGTIEQKRAGILSFLRMSGTFALDDIRAIVQPYFLYADPSQIQIIETDRAALETANTVAGVALGPAAVVSGSVTILDDPRVSPAGAILNFSLTTTRLDLVTVILTGPDGTVGIRSAPFLSQDPESITGVTFRVNFPEFASKQINGTWSVQISTPTVNVTIPSWSLFVEGLGMNFVGAPPVPNGEGLGAPVFEFLVVAEEDKLGTGYDLQEAQRSITRWKPAHTLGGIGFIPSGGTLCAIPDTLGAIPDLAVPCS